MSSAPPLPFRLDSLGAIDWAARLRVETPFLCDALAAAPSRRILDLGCGEGHHAAALAAEGFEVVGIDASPERLERAQERGTDATVEFVQGEIGAGESGVRGHFGGALCLGDTLAEQIGTESVARLLVGLRRRLLPGAPVVLQLHNFERLYARRQRALDLQIHDGEDGAEGSLVCLRLLDLRSDGVVVLSTAALRHDPATLDPESHPPIAPVAHRNSFLQGWQREELETLLEVARFPRREVWGGVDRQPFHPVESPQLVIVAR